MSTTELPDGSIEVAPQAIATIVVGALRGVAGVAALARPAPLDEQSAALWWRDARQGIEVRGDERELALDIYLIIEYGSPIAEVVAAAQRQVRAALAASLHIADARVNIHVQGVRSPR
jgi:uncharacterized alkaline shock family protein YloU